VARLNYESGSVSFRPGSADDWSPASPNYPLTIGDHLWADRDARAEMHIGSTAVRMDSETALSVLNLDDRTVQLSLTAGVIEVRLRALDDDQTFEVDTPNVAISLLRPGDYRIQADGDGATTSVAVWSGEAELTGGGTAFPPLPRLDGRPTDTATGSGSRPGAGRGWMTLPGDSRRSITAAGPMPAEGGSGCRARLSRGRSMLRRWLLSSAGRGSACR
jgi:hypothetical protein